MSKKIKKPEAPPFSLSIEEVLRLMDEAQKDYVWNCNQVRKMDSLTQDYLHNLELGNLPYKERAKIATKLAQCRRLRREHKDTVETLQPLVEYLDSAKGKAAIDGLRDILGKTRKTEERMKNRVYYNRILGGWIV